MLDKAKEIQLFQEFDPNITSKMRICILGTRWNQPIVQSLIQGATHTLQSKYGVQNIDTITVPGSYELPFAAKSLIELAKEKGKPYDAVIAIGVLIKGSTMHFEYICEAVSQGIMRVGLDTGVPTIFGVLTCLNDEQV